MGENAVVIMPTPEIERALTAEAQRQGTTPELLALDTLRERFVPEKSPAAGGEAHRTLADFLAGYVGVLDSSEFGSEPRMSEATGRKFAAGMVEKRRQGRL